jgi:NADH:ubiquinone oxidoreductase subunit C
MSKNMIPKEEIFKSLQEFYKPAVHHLVSLHGVDVGGALEVQWVFAHYAGGELEVFASVFDYADTVPSISSMLPSAWIHEAELKDMFGIDVEGAKFGLLLEKDGVKAPLRKVQ